MTARYKRTTEKRRQRWERYEFRKQLLRQEDLSPDEYERAIKKLTKELGI